MEIIAIAALLAAAFIVRIVWMATEDLARLTKDRMLAHRAVTQTNR